MRFWKPGLSTTIAKSLGFLLVFPQLLIRKLTAGQIKGSTILDALEANHGKTAFWRVGLSLVCERGGRLSV